MADPNRSRTLLPVNALIKIPRQQRARDTVHTILDGTVKLLNGPDSSELTTNRVAEVSGVSIGTLYQYFASKEALIAGVLERGMLGVEQALRSVTLPSRDPLDQVMTRGLQLVLKLLTPYAPLLREILSTSPMLSRNGILAVLEPRLTALAHTFMLGRTDAQVIGGGAALYVAVHSTMVTILRWVAEPSPWVSKEALIESLVRQAMAHAQPAG